MKSIILFASILRIVLITVILGFAVYANAQNVAMNTNGAAADASAMLDVASTTKGFLPPRMTSIQRLGIPSPANGLMVFDTDTKSYWYFSATWKEVTIANGGNFTLPYSGTGSDPSKVFSITNTNTSIGSSSIFGMSGSVSSGILNLKTSGIWGDNSQFDGYGVLGTSSYGHGVAGFSSAFYGVYGSSSGSAYAGVVGTNTNNLGVGVYGYMPNGGDAIVALNDGSQGNSGRFFTSGPGNSDDAVYILTQGKGRALLATINNSTSTAEGFNLSTNGLGRAMYVGTSNTANNSPAVYMNHYGLNDVMQVYSNNATGNSFLFNGFSQGLGGGINITLFNTNSTYEGVRILHQGSGNGLSITAEKGEAGVFSNKAGNTKQVIEANNYGTNIAGDFATYNTSNTAAVLSAYTSGTGAGLLVENANANAVTSLATFKKNGANKARIDGTGKGFFNGGTQSSGADVAEAFDVTGNRSEYEAGDVLIISTDKDRAVEKSAQPYSTLVAGVYATKPGVLLTEENIETDISDKVPMGVVGVIPTKVCLQGGEIKRGDLLVTSSIPGVAMKADIEKVKPGQVIGKALENFTSASTGRIKVLVNVK